MATLSACGHKKVYTEKHIDATPQQIWSVLMDTKAYAQWNEFIPNAEGNYALGATIINHAVMPNASKPTEMKTKVITFEKEQLLHQHGGIPGIITFDHRYRLNPKNDGTTLLIQEEDYKGLYVWFWDANMMKPVYDNVNESLATYITQKKNQ